MCFNIKYIKRGSIGQITRAYIFDLFLLQTYYTYMYIAALVYVCTLRVLLVPFGGSVKVNAKSVEFCTATMPLAESD